MDRIYLDRVKVYVRREMDRLGGSNISVPVKLGDSEIRQLRKYFKKVRREPFGYIRFEREASCFYCSESPAKHHCPSCGKHVCEECWGDWGDCVEMCDRCLEAQPTQEEIKEARGCERYHQLVEEAGRP